MCSYLKWRVLVNGSVSFFASVGSGIPQGSILGPYFIDIFMSKYTFKRAVSRNFIHQLITYYPIFLIFLKEVIIVEYKYIFLLYIHSFIVMVRVIGPRSDSHE